MFEQIAVAALTGLAIYLGVGVLFAIVFVTLGVTRIDAAAGDTNWAFRLMILPASAALWPLLMRRWMQGGESPEQKDPHTP
jgi:hypothetical protein